MPAAAARLRAVAAHLLPRRGADEHAATASAPAAAGGDDDVDVAIIGAGFSGLMAAVRVMEAGCPPERVRIFDRAPSVGGCWFWNQYPGCACDVPSYDYLPYVERTGFVPSTRYAAQPEILSYARLLAARFRLLPSLRLNCAVTRAAWDAAEGRWGVETAAGACRARVLVAAVGLLDRPRDPALPGAASFRGDVVHTARWDPALRVEGRTVGVVGTGASAVQVVPWLALRAKQLHVFQRTAVYTIPQENTATSPDLAHEIAANPGSVVKSREGFQDNELDAELWPQIQVKKYNRAAARAAIKRLHKIVADPAVAASLSPDPDRFPFWCKRVAPSDQYWATFNRPNVRLVAGGVEAVTERGAVVAGREWPVDVLVYATGFDAWAIDCDVVGAGGRRLSDAWADVVPRTWQGVLTEGFPNLFTMLGPQSYNPIGNAGLCLQRQAAALGDLYRSTRGGRQVFEPRPSAVDAWVRTCAELEPRSPFAMCANWYTRDPAGERKPAGGLYTGSQRAVVDALRTSAAAGWPDLRIGE